MPPADPGSPGGQPATRGRVCMLTTEHAALDIRIFYKEACSLRDAGYDVSIVAPLRQGSLFARGDVSLGSDRIESNGIDIIGFTARHRLPPRLGDAQRWLKLLTAGSVDLLPSYRDLIARAVALEADVYHCHEIDSLCAAIAVRKLLARRGRSTKIVYDAHEFSPAGSQRASRRIVAVLFRQLIISFENRVCRKVDAVITVNEQLRGYFLSFHPPVPVEVLYNCPHLSGPAAEREDRSDKLTICYLGIVRPNRGLADMLEVVKILKRRYGDRIELLLIGSLDEPAKRLLASKKEEYALGEAVRLTGWLPYEELFEVLSSADAGLFLVDQRPRLFSTSTKLFDYMAAGLPVIAYGLPCAGAILEQHGAGIVVERREPEVVAQALAELFDDPPTHRRMAANAREAIEKFYNWTLMEKRLVRLYRGLLST